MSNRRKPVSSAPSASLFEQLSALDVELPNRAGLFAGFTVGNESWEVVVGVNGCGAGIVGLDLFHDRLNDARHCYRKGGGIGAGLLLDPHSIGRLAAVLADVATALERLGVHQTNC